MNKEQRGKLDIMASNLESIVEEEQNKYDNAPEGLQDSDRIQKFQENADRLQEAVDIIREVLDDS